ncbi:MAG TPA: hypothetical protein VLX67_09805, partial [Stellaceae bacterium]|nr:hypothetical protein [Stellaceae bacterium]
AKVHEVALVAVDASAAAVTIESALGWSLCKPLAERVWGTKSAFVATGLQTPTFSSGYAVVLDDAAKA